jgi:hypothetical protein
MRRHGASFALGVAPLSACLLVAACDVEDVVIYARPSSDASPDNDRSTPGDEATLSDGSTDSGDTNPESACVLGPGRACQPNGADCVAAVDCCSARCVDGVCLEPGTCGGPGIVCAARSDCCSARCEPVPGSGAQACLTYCVADGGTCTSANDCCSLACNGGVCGGAICGENGDACATDADCCGGICSVLDGRCVIDAAATCRATGENCTSGGGSPCCFICDDATSRCDFGPGACRPNGTPCIQDGDCCRGTCAAGASGVPVCTATPLLDGTPCTSPADCVGGACGGAPPICSAEAASCSLIGASCALDSECCGALCVSGACASGCTPP